MELKSRQDAAAATMRRINQVWLDGNVEALAPMLHPDIVMAVPGFISRIQGQEKFLDGFRDFCQNAKIHEFGEYDQQVDVADDTAVVTFRFDMTYERAGERYHSTGRDFWVFQNQDSKWIAVWRTMLDVNEEPA